MLLRTFASAAATESGSARSMAKAAPSFFSSLISAAIVFVARPSRSKRAPAAASARAHSRPMPRDAPEISAVRPARSRLAAVVLDIVVDGLPEHELRQLRWLERRLEHAPERNDDVLRRRDRVLQKIDFEVEIAMIDFSDDLALDDRLHLRQIDHVSGPRIGRALH